LLLPPAGANSEKYITNQARGLPVVRRRKKDKSSRLFLGQGVLEDDSVDRIRTIAFSPDSSHLLTVGVDRHGAPIVCLWDIRAGQPVEQWDWQIGDVNQVAVAPYEMTAATTGSDQLLLVGDLDV
jgi:hypothetical protein